VVDGPGAVGLLLALRGAVRVHGAGVLRSRVGDWGEGALRFWRVRSWNRILIVLPREHVGGGAL
jgi:hypothetical protein